MSRKTPIADLIDCLDLPHLRKDGKWMQTGAAPALEPGFSRDRAIFYAGKLRELGMRDADISCLISDLYWDSFIEAKLNRTFEKPNL
jgi:hypothetical protein